MSKPFGLAVKAVIVDQQDRCLLLRRSKINKSFVGCWEWPGGKVDPGEDFATAILREVREETGLEIEITALAGTTWFEMEHLRLVLLCMEARANGGEIRLSDEHDDFAWVPWGNLSHYPMPASTTEFVLDYAKTKGTRR